MSEKKYIEGPWRFVEREVMEDGSVYPQHIVGGPQELQICLLEGPVVAEAAVKNNWPAGKPRSADLLLAAPDLLEALQAVLREAVILSADYLEAFRDLPDDAVIQGWDKARWKAALVAEEKARVAIAKATGAQS